MGEQCGSEPTIYEEEEEYERARRARVDEYDCSFNSRQLAALLVDTEDELGADIDGMCTGMHADVAEARAEIERLSRQVAEFRGWRASVYEVARSSFRSADRARKSADRYRLAWLSARRRAADEHNFGVEALEMKRDEIFELRVRVERLMADLESSRKTTHAPRLEHVGEDENGPVYRLARTSGPDGQTSGARRPITEV